MIFNGCSSITLAVERVLSISSDINDNLLHQALSIFENRFGDREKTGMLGDYCLVKSGFAFKSSWWTNEGVKVVKIGSISQDNLNLEDCSYVSSDIGKLASEFMLQSGDLVIAMTGATIGKFTMIPLINEPLYANQRVGKFFLGDDPIKKLPFIYCLLKNKEVYNEILNRGQGSAQPNISSNDIMTVPCAIPSSKEIDDFNNDTKAFFELIIRNQAEIQNLIKLRNELLPKLMTGEIDLSNIEIE